MSDEIQRRLYDAEALLERCAHQLRQGFDILRITQLAADVVWYADAVAKGKNVRTASPANDALRTAFEAWCKTNCSPHAETSEWYWQLFRAGASAARAADQPSGGDNNGA